MAELASVDASHRSNLPPEMCTFFWGAIVARCRHSRRSTSGRQNRTERRKSQTRKPRLDRNDNKKSPPPPFPPQPTESGRPGRAFAARINRIINRRGGTFAQQMPVRTRLIEIRYRWQMRTNGIGCKCVRQKRRKS